MLVEISFQFLLESTITNLTTVKEQDLSSAWSPDGKYIAYYNDATDEYELYLLENKEGAKPTQITKNSKGWSIKQNGRQTVNIWSFLTEACNSSLLM